MAFPRQPFSFFFFESLLNLVLEDLSLVIKWAGLPFLFWVLDLADGFLAISFHVLSTVDYWACWALDPWWITEVLDLVYRGPKKWASTTDIQYCLATKKKKKSPLGIWPSGAKEFLPPIWQRFESPLPSPNNVCVCVV